LEKLWWTLLQSTSMSLERQITHDLIFLREFAILGRAFFPFVINSILPRKLFLQIFFIRPNLFDFSKNGPRNYSKTTILPEPFSHKLLWCFTLLILVLILIFHLEFRLLIYLSPIYSVFLSPKKFSILDAKIWYQTLSLMWP